jgi:hypothetical protein
MAARERDDAPVSSRMPTASDTRRVFARDEGIWYLRHAAALARWPVLAEPWAHEIERQRLESEAPGRRAGPPRDGP